METRRSPYPTPDIRPFRGLAVPPPDDYPFARERKAAEDLLQFGREYLSERTFKVNNEADQVVMTEFVRVASTCEAVIALALDGYGVQGSLLTRPMYESYLTAWWAHTHPEETEDRYPLHCRFLRQLFAEATDDEIPPEDVLVGDELKRARSLFGQYAELSWTGRKLWEIAEEHAQSQGNDDLRHGHREFYDVHHRILNWSLHSTEFASYRHIDRLDEELATYVIGPAENSVLACLALSSLHSVNMYELVIEHFNLDCLPALRTVDWAAMVVFGPENANTGRNDPCPCSSGQKFKHCHGR